MEMNIFWGSELWNWHMDVQPSTCGEYHTCIYVVWSKPAPSHHQQPPQLSLLQANLLEPAAGKTCNYWLLMGNTYNGNTKCGGKTIQHATYISLSMQLGMFFFKGLRGIVHDTVFKIQNDLILWVWDAFTFTFTIPDTCPNVKVIES